MNIYFVSPDADDILIEKIARLFLQQRTLNDVDKYLTRTIQTIKLSLENPAQSGIIAAEDGDEIIGFAFYNMGVSLQIGGTYIWLNELYVQESSRNKGIAKKLLLKLIYWAEKEGIKSIELETGVNNSVTKHLYNSLGFHDIVSKRYNFNF
ncbi:GNAT family N-acetyltransferase [Fictibacillus iocasae]|uniref:GNAT family N-acetyltransferase n=1 Tax=Fictibacillus iocasae TaxID=2715437 RepID=A0ABW2NRB7_9BACL